MASRSVLVANPAADVYGSDLQLLESVRGLVAAGHRVSVVTSTDGPLSSRLVEAGATHRVLDYPVLQRAFASPQGIARLAARAAGRMPAMVGLLRRLRPDVVYVNTVTLPWWLTAARLAGVPALCHVHEAEQDVSRKVALAMNGPLVQARRVVVNSHVTEQTVRRAAPRVGDRLVVVHNGVAGPPAEPVPGDLGSPPVRLVCVGRLSQRKDALTALEAVALLRGRGRDVTIELCGSPVPGKESYRTLLERRAAEPDLAGAVTLTGYVSPVWTALARNDVFLSPSTGESFGNVTVEAQLALRPVVVTGVDAHLETVVDGETGLLVPVGDAAAFADAVESLVADPDRAAAMADAARARAQELFGVERYHRAICEVVDGLGHR